MGRRRNRPQKQKRSAEHQRQVEELRRSNAAGVHGDHRYSRTQKHRKDYRDARNWED